MPELSVRFVLVVVAGYFLGSVPFGLLLSLIFGGGDVRRSGSGNIGATNVARVAGPLPGILTLLLDAGKGSLAVWAGSHFFPGNARAMMLTGLAALLGHCFPLWLAFKGGKGVATAAGVFLALSPPAFLGGVLVFALVAGFYRFVSLASLSAAAAMPLLLYFFWAPHHAPPLVITFGALAAALLVFYKHDANIQRLVEGQEPRFSLGRKKDRA